MPITIDIDPTFSGFNQSNIKKILKTVFKGEGSLINEMSLVFGDDILLNKLKKNFFNIDQWTDVIAFRLNNYNEKKVEGEIYISIPRAKENAQLFNEPFNKEIGRLIIHGCLHLLNYDDQTDDEKTKMTRKEDEYLQQCEWRNLIDE